MRMLEPMKQKTKERDFMVIARNVAEKAIGSHMDGSPLEVIVARKDAVAIHRGLLGGLRGGKARSFELSAGRRTQIAKKAAKARWKKQITRQLDFSLDRFRSGGHTSFTYKLRFIGLAPSNLRPA